MRILTAAAAAVTIAAAMPAAAADYPDIPEPMVFDMIRPLGAKKGELEINALATTPLSGQSRVVEWAPEIEYAVTDGFAIEFELPFENARLTELKLGLQKTFGTMDNGRIAHGVQYLGIYDRHDDSASHAVLYMIGRRHSEKLSTMTMVGVGDVRVGQPESEAGLLVNHSTFYHIAEDKVAGLELNYKSGQDGGVLAMPQYHGSLAKKVAIQAGAGVDKQRGAKARPVAGLRLIREF
ncbi:hypothetical protein [Sphingomonas sp. Y38-1Y]|uniref:hypothetical protein n=1 Tax=Sphingomonas sp. Y38-1Y TaxID=3078265 RepID=UPI0028ED4AFE|nr:hypothetical protein [Sphingomonas sp. Y38-1Y]